MSELQKIWQDLKQSPAILITVIVVIIAILYYVYKQNNQSQQSATTTAIPQSPYNIENISITPPQQGPAGPPGPQGPPGPATNPTPVPPAQIVNQLAGKTKATAGDSLDKPNGVPVFATAGGNVTRYQPYNSDVTVTGTTTTINGVDYYPIGGGGFIRERDLLGFG